MVLSPSYTWSETKGGLTVIAQCTGASVSTTDVFSSPHYVSLNSAPYFLELDLHGEVTCMKVESCVCAIRIPGRRHCPHLCRFYRTRALRPLRMAR